MMAMSSTDTMKDKLLQWKQKKGRLQPERLPWEPRFRKNKLDDAAASASTHDKENKSSRRAEYANEESKAMSHEGNPEKNRHKRLETLYKKFEKMDMQSKQRDPEAGQRAARRAEYGKALRDKMRQQSSCNKRSTFPSKFSLTSSDETPAQASQLSGCATMLKKVVASKWNASGSTKSIGSDFGKQPPVNKNGENINVKKSIAKTTSVKHDFKMLKRATANTSISRRTSTPKPLQDVPYYLVKSKSNLTTPRKSLGVAGNASARKSLSNLCSASTAHRRAAARKSEGTPRFEPKRGNAAESRNISQARSSMAEAGEAASAEMREDVLNTTFEKEDDDDDERDVEARKAQRDKSKKSVSFFVPCVDDVTPQREKCDADAVCVNLSCDDASPSLDATKSLAGHTPRYNANGLPDDKVASVASGDSVDALTRYLELLVGGHPCDDISAKLDALSEEKPAVRNDSKYWFCRSQVAIQSGDVNEALRLFELALKHYAEVEPSEELHANVLDLQRRISIGKSARKSCQPDVEAENAFESSTIKFCISTPHKSFSDLAAYTMTPVRRSARFGRQKESETAFEEDAQLPICVDSMQKVPSRVRKSILYKKNPALSDWEIAVEYGEPQLPQHENES